MNDDANTYEELVTQIHYLPPQEQEVIHRAFDFAYAAHGTQKRKSGEPYIHHPLAVAHILADMQMDAQSITAALLHDVIEDTPATYEQIETDFGSQVAQLVLGVTNLGEKVEALKKVSAAFNNDLTHEQRTAASLANLFLAMSADIRVIIIKLADRLHNMRTIRWLTPAKQSKKAQETVELFIPVATRLGIWEIKEELEDLCLQVLDPEAYAEIEELLQARTRLLTHDQEATLTQLHHKFEIDGCSAAVIALPERISRLYRYIRAYGWESAQTYDGLRIQVITETHAQCYAALGSVHDLWAPVPGRFKDFIAIPKEGIYRALHTTVIGLRGRPLEVRILTQQMQHLAKYGIVGYLQQASDRGTLEQLLPRLSWIAELAELPTDDPTTFLNLFKSEITPERIRVFTPKGRVVDLPAGATPVDFAYAVHTEIGHSCRKAIVNGQYAPLTTVLKSGDQVEIIKALAPGPDRAWLDEDLDYTYQSYTRRQIRRWFARQPEEVLIAQGQELIEKEIACWGEYEGWSSSDIERLARQRGLTQESLCLRVGRGDSSASELGVFVLSEILENPVDRPEPLTLEIHAMDRPNLMRDACQIVADENVNLLSAWVKAADGTGLATLSLTLDALHLRKIVRIAHRIAQLLSVIQLRRCPKRQTQDELLGFPFSLPPLQESPTPPSDHLAKWPASSTL